MAGVLTEAAGPLSFTASNIQDFEIIEDFLAGTNTTGQIGTHGWVSSAGTLAAQASVANHIGIQRQATAATINTFNSFFPGTGASQGVLPMGTMTLSAIVRPVQIDANTVIRIGFMNNTASTPTAGQYIERLGTDTNWFGVTQHASTPLRTDLGIAANTTDWMNFSVERTGSSSVTFVVNGAALATHTGATITSTGCFGGFQVQTLENAAKSVDIDWARIWLQCAR